MQEKKEKIAIKKLKKVKHGLGIGFQGNFRKANEANEYDRRSMNDW